MSRRGPTEVLLVVHHLSRQGGHERAAAELAVRLRERGFTVRVVTRENLLPEELGTLRIPSPRRPFMALFPIFFLLASIVVARARRRGAIVHTVGALVVNKADVVTVQFVHAAGMLDGTARPSSMGSRAGRFNARLAAATSRAAERWIYSPSRARRLVAVSHGIRAELQAAYPAMTSRVSVIPNGVDPAVFRPDPVARAKTRGDLSLPDQAPVAVFVGGDWQRKGLDLAIAALAVAPNWRLVVVGPGNADAMRGTAAVHGVEDRVHFAGMCADPQRYLNAADVFVFPTLYEAFPLVVLEAAATGLPLVTTRVNGAEEVVVDDVTGFIVDRTADSIATRLLQLEDDVLRARLGAGAHAASRAYEWDRIADEYAAIYRSLTP